MLSAAARGILGDDAVEYGDEAETRSVRGGIAVRLRGYPVERCMHQLPHRYTEAFAAMVEQPANLADQLPVLIESLDSQA